MDLKTTSVAQFAEDTFSKAPVPGGGGVAAVVGSLGAALGGMVCNLTVGKKKYMEFEEDVRHMLPLLRALMENLQHLAEQDADNFVPLAACYALPAGPESEEKMQAALKAAIQAPIAIMKQSYEAMLLLDELKEKSAALVLSDVGCGVLCLDAALQMGWLNVKINLESIADEAYCEALKQDLLPLLENGPKLARRVYAFVEEKI